MDQIMKENNILEMNENDESETIKSIYETNEYNKQY